MLDFPLLDPQTLMTSAAATRAKRVKNTHRLQHHVDQVEMLHHDLVLDETHI
jgi:hypothetical protein